MPVVLVVDDEPDIRALLKINLEGAGYRVVTAASGDEALAAVRADPPDAMLLDVMMPGLDGWAVLEAVKAGHGDLSGIPVFLVTAVDGDEHRFRGGIEGALRYITKPFDPVELVRELEAVLDPQAPAEPELRRRVQAASLEALARFERGDRAASGEPIAAEHTPRVRLTRLEHLPSSPIPSPRLRRARERVEQLTPKQRQLVEELASGMSVTVLAEQLGISRSNVYASLRRIGRKLGLKGTNELLVLVRQGGLADPRP